MELIQNIALPLHSPEASSSERSLDKSAAFYRAGNRFHGLSVAESNPRSSSTA
jgi:hypothetical protein